MKTIKIWVILIVVICLITLGIFLYRYSDMYSNENSVNEKISMNNEDNNKMNIYINDVKGLNFGDYSIDYPYQWCLSKNNKYIIYSKSKNLIAPDIYIYNFSTKEEKQLTNNLWYAEEYPVVNDFGDYAYAAYEKSFLKSTIILNGNTLFMEKQGVATGLLITDKYLYVGYKTNTDEHYLYIYNLKNELLSKIEVEGGINRLLYYNDSNILIEAFSYKTKSMDIFMYDLENKQIKTVKSSHLDDLIQNIDSDGKIITMTIDGTNNARYLFNSFYTLYSNQYFNPFSITNDFGGRLSWNQSARLSGMVQLYKLTYSGKLLNQIKNTVANILNTTNLNYSFDKNFNSEFIWSQPKFSHDGDTYISTFVENSYLLYNLIKTANSSVLDNQEIKEIINICENAFDYFESWYDPISYGYRIPKGYPQYYDGILVPWNQQNMFGLMLAELYKATNNEIYLNRVLELANAFKNGFVDNDDILLWRYWGDPLIYKGWTENDDISVNLPNCEPWDSSLMESTGYAGSNIRFILECNKLFGDIVFTNNDMKKLSKTYEFIMANKEYPSYLDGRGSKSIVENIIGGGWLSIATNDLLEDWLHLGYYKCANPVNNCIDVLINYTNCVNNIIEGEEYLNIDIEHINEEFIIINKEIKKIKWSDISEYVKQYVFYNGIN